MFGPRAVVLPSLLNSMFGKMKLAPTLTRVPSSADMPAGLKKMILGSAA